MTDALFDVTDAIVVITGVCGQLGDEYARAFLERGARVAGTDLAPSERSAKLAADYGARFLFCSADVTVKNDLIGALDQIRSSFGEPTVLVNNAALDSTPSAPAEENGPFETYPEESWDKIISVNLKGVYLCCQVFGDAMACNGNGSIINIGSIYGIVSPDQSLYEYRRARGETFFKPIGYSASKSGIVNMTRYLAVYWARKGVRVNTLSLAGVFNNQEKEFLDAYCSRIPAGRMADVSEYNGALLFLASRSSRYMTGHNMIVDGGWTAI